MKIALRSFALSAAICITILLSIGLISYGNIFGFIFGKTNSVNETSVDNITINTTQHPNPVLADNEKQQLINIAMSQPNIRAWSNQWNFSTINFKGEKTNTGVNWQEAIVFLRLSPSASTPFKCDNGWVAEVRIDMITHKVIDSLSPSVQSHQCQDTNVLPTENKTAGDILISTGGSYYHTSNIYFENTKYNYNVNEPIDPTIRYGVEEAGIETLHIFIVNAENQTVWHYDSHLNGKNASGVLPQLYHLHDLTEPPHISNPGLYQMIGQSGNMTGIFRFYVQNQNTP